MIETLPALQWRANLLKTQVNAEELAQALSVENCKEIKVPPEVQGSLQAFRSFRQDQRVRAADRFLTGVLTSMIENKETFFARLEARLAPSDLIRVRGAYYMAKYGHRAQVRKELDADGNHLRYFEHVRRVAIILMDEHHVYNADIICAALLHDVLEDTEDINAEIIEQFFGTRTALYVRMLTKKPKSGYFHRLRHADDEVILIKLCDRRDNLLSLPATDPVFIEKTLRDTYALLGVVHLVAGSLKGTKYFSAVTAILLILQDYSKRGICTREYESFSDLQFNAQPKTEEQIAAIF